MFGLLATGTYDWCDGRQCIVCQNIFTTKEKAEAFKPEFKRKCVTPKDKYDLRFLQDNDRLVIQLIEYTVL
jgi:hypothetical protein